VSADADSGQHVRLLTIMGSGETAPTMVKVHRAVFERLATNRSSDPAGGAADAQDASDGILLDTPFGFQTNAAEIGAKAVNYFRESVGAKVEVAGLRSAADLSGPGGDRIVTAIARAGVVFAGPGSPSYALRQWRDTLVPSLIAEKLALGGAVTFASAAALTLGVATVPVYEIYKVGEDPHWLEGLDLIASLGLRAVIIPHYDNAEGQTHDTRYCYLGEERLAHMENELDADTYVLGVDEHTALMVDLDAATVVGNGAMTIRVRGNSLRVEAGGVVTLDQIAEIARSLSSPVSGALSHRRVERDFEGAADLRGSSERGAGQIQTGEAPSGQALHAPAGADGGSPLLSAIRRHEAEFRSAREVSDVPHMVGAALALENELWAWRADTLQSDEMDRGRASLRAMIGELGQLSAVGARDPATVVGPYVEVALAIRDAARSGRRFAEADEVRDRLERLGVEVHDGPDGSTWELKKTAGPNSH
jgi:cyanophycinase-like exopeptidase